MIIDNKELPYFYHVLYTGTKKGVKGTAIERYYDDFRHVRIVPYFAVRDKINFLSHERFGEVAANFYSSDKKPNYKTWISTPAPGSIEYDYRSLIKMNWLINDIQERGCREPITGVLRPDGFGEFKIDVHPGTFRQYAFDLLDLDHPCIVFDAFEYFSEYAKVTLETILKLFSDEAGTKVEISMLPRDTSYMTPQILNTQPKGINCSMAPTMVEWEKLNRHLFDKPVKIFIGYDSTHYDTTNVCHNSILDSLLPQHRSKIEIIHLDVSKIPGWTREYKNQSTEFTYSRFLVPHLSNYEGISIFVDDDFIFTENILNLLYFISYDKAVACVKHDFSKKFDSKFNNEKDMWYPKKLWSSLMVFNNAHPDCKKLTLESVQEQTGKYLHQFEWTDEDKIGSIPKRWNWCEGYDELADMHKAHGLHFTRGGPWIDGMDCAHIAGVELYEAYRIKHMVGIDKNKFTYHPKQVSIVNMRDYYDLDNPVKECDDGSLICKEINKQKGD